MGDVLLTTLHGVEVSGLTEHFTGGGIEMSYWPFYKEWNWVILLTTLQGVELRDFTGYFTKDEIERSYWGLYMGWKLEILQTTLHRAKVWYWIDNCGSQMSFSAISKMFRIHPV